MKTLIITGDASSSGCLKAARRADATVGLWPRLIVGPLPDEAIVARIFGARNDAFEDAFLERRGPIMPRDADKLPGSTEGLKALCRNFDRVELWFDPVAESQLALALVLDYLRDDPHLIASLTLVHPDSRICEMKPEAAMALHPFREAVTEVHLQLATRVWTAWSASTPEDFVGLLEQDTTAFPFLGRSILRLLDELPALNNGLGASELILLRLLEQREDSFESLLTRYHQQVWPETYTGFDAGELLDDLCRSAEPAVLGLPPGPYDMALMQDDARRTRYLGSSLSLSDFGRRLLEKHADFAQGKPSPRWWGGTELTSERPWRWDAAARELHCAA